MKIKLAKLMSAVAASRRGATAIEYGLMAGLIGLAIAVGATALGSSVSGKFTTVGSCVTTPTGSGC